MDYEKLFNFMCELWGTMINQTPQQIKHMIVKMYDEEQAVIEKLMSSEEGKLIYKGFCDAVEKEFGNAK